MSYHYKEVLRVPKTPAEIREEMRLEGHVALNQKVQARDANGNIVLIGLVQYVGPGYARVIIKKQFIDPPIEQISFKVRLAVNGHINMQICYNGRFFFEAAHMGAPFKPAPTPEVPWPEEPNPQDVPHPTYDVHVENLE